METKPYNLQSPEQIAKDYGGNKQKIAEAMQMGIVDPTAGTLAGMFIDRMRSAAQTEAAPQQTVAQQVFAPPAPVAPGVGAMPQGGMQPPAPAGLGATPEAAMMAQQMPAPEMAPPPAPEMPAEEVPMGMAEGGTVPPYMSGSGISDLPLPDDMFDENRNGGFNDGYAGGGLVAFAQGDSVTAPSGFGDYIEQMARKIDPNIQIAGRARTAARNAEVGGVPGSYHLIDAARDIRTPEGMNKSDFIAQLKSVFGPDYDVLPSKGNSVHVEPGPKLGEKVRAGARSGNPFAVAPQRDVNTVEGQVASVEDIFGRLQQRFGPSEEERASRAKLMARAEELASPEYEAKMRKDSLWETLATIGFNMASSKSPSLLQAVGEAAAAALPGAAADKKERKALRDRGLELMVELGASNRKEAIPLWNMATEAAKTNMSQQQFIQKQKLDERQVDLAERRLNEEIRQAGLVKPEDIKDRIQRYALDYAPGTPQHEAAMRIINANRSSTGGLTPEQIKANLGAGREGGGGFSEGQTAKDTKGRTIVFQGGQWVYP